MSTIEETNSETPTTSPSAPAGSVEHIFYEIGNDLLSRPNALCDILAVEGYPPAVVFCNSPSDTDLTEVMLRKRGVSTRKLIGHVSPGKVSECLQALKSREVSTLVVTDIAAEGIDSPEIRLVVNYTVHNDPEVYLNRAILLREDGQTKKSISLVAPLDVAKFHYTKKVVDHEFRKGELPSQEELLGAHVETMAKEAVEKDYATVNDKVKALVTLIERHPSREQLIALLAYNTIEVLPSLSAQSDRGQSDRGGSQYRDNGDERGDEGRGRGRNRRGRDRYENRGDDDGGSRRRFDNDEDSSGSNERSGEERQEGGRNGRHQRRRESPPIRDIRFYVGCGSKDGFNAEELRAMLGRSTDIPQEEVKRWTIRPLYSFVDISEQVADVAAEQLTTAQRDNGDKVVVRRAVTINTPREENSNDDSGSNNDFNESNESHSHSEEMSSEGEASACSFGEDNAEHA